jgi:pilus assembly protein CpaB
MRILAILVLIIGVAFAGGAVFYAKRFFDEQAIRISAQPETVRILTAKRSLKPGTELLPQDLQWTEWPRDLVSDDAFTSASELLGDVGKDHRWVEKSIEKGQPVLRGQLSELNEPKRINYDLPPGMRAISFRISAETGVSGFVHPGDRVDIMFVRNVGGDLVSSLLLQDVQVLAINQDTNTERTGAKVGHTVTVAVTIEQAHRIALARESGRLSLLLRGPKAEPDETSGPMNGDELNGPPPVAAPDKPTIRLREGGEVTDVPVGN